MTIWHTRRKFLKAAAKGDLKTVDEFFSASGTQEWISLRDGKGSTALHLAAENGHTELVVRLLQAGADPNACNDARVTPLFLAAQQKHALIGKLLLAAGADPNSHNDNYCGAIHWAAHNGDSDFVQALVDAGADINLQQTDTGRTALHYAVYGNHFRTVEILLQQPGLRTDLPCKEGWKAMDAARMKGLENIIALLGKHGTADEKAADGCVATVHGASDEWSLSGNATLVHVETLAGISRRLTTIFNFASRERILISENLKTGQETVTSPESFDRIDDAALARAVREYKRLGGKTGDDGAGKGRIISLG